MTMVKCAVCRAGTGNYTIIQGTSLCHQCADHCQKIKSKYTQGVIQKMRNNGDLDYEALIKNNFQFSVKELDKINKGAVKVLDSKKKERAKDEARRQAKIDYLDTPVRRRDIKSKQTPNKQVDIQIDPEEPTVTTNRDRTMTKLE